MKCRVCSSSVLHDFIDLGVAPPSNNLLLPNQLSQEEQHFPLKTVACGNCLLVQTEDYVAADIMFTADYAYFSSYSSTWLTHASNYVNQMIKRLSLSSKSLVVEIAANDGYLLQYVQSAKIPCLGVEPTLAAAKVAESKGLEVIKEFFGENLASKILLSHGRADLIVANNVLAHVPDPLDVMIGIRRLLADGGVATIEFHWLHMLVTKLAVDTIYHEHFSYYSLHSFEYLAHKAGLQVVDVEELSTHGGSLRVHLMDRSENPQVAETVVAIKDIERKSGLNEISYYESIGAQVRQIKTSVHSFLAKAKANNKKVVGYGAAAKASTLLNYCGITDQQISYVVDKSPSKINKIIPGCRIPIVDIERLVNDDVDIVVIFPWNIATEIMAEVTGVVRSPVSFYTWVPSVKEIG